LASLAWLFPPQAVSARTAPARRIILIVFLSSIRRPLFGGWG
jgi:hypothetical protein